MPARASAATVNVNVVTPRKHRDRRASVHLAAGRTRHTDRDRGPQSATVQVDRPSPANGSPITRY